MDRRSESVNINPLIYSFQTVGQSERLELGPISTLPKLPSIINTNPDRNCESFSGLSQNPAPSRGTGLSFSLESRDTNEDREMDHDDSLGPRGQCDWPNTGNHEAKTARERVLRDMAFRSVYFTFSHT
jgi:hypothetical protein